MYQHVYIVNPRIRLISGRHTITEEDLGLPKGTLPPQDVASLGSLITVDPDSLRPGLKIRTSVKRLCESKGPKVGMGTAVPAEQLQDLLDQMSDLKARFTQWKSEFLANFRSNLDSRASAHSQYKDLIKASAPTEQYIRDRLSFDVDVYKLAVASDDPAKDVLSSTLERDGNDIGKALIIETASFCRQTFERSMAKSRRVGRRNLAPLKDTLLPKLRSFQLLDSRCRPVADLIEKIITKTEEAIFALPKAAPAALVDGDFDEFARRFEILKHADRLQAYARQHRSDGFVGKVSNDAPRGSTGSNPAASEEAPNDAPTPVSAPRRGLPRRPDAPPASEAPRRAIVNF